MTYDKGLGLYVFGYMLCNTLTLVGLGWEYISRNKLYISKIRCMTFMENKYVQH